MSHKDELSSFRQFTVELGARGRFVLPAQLRHYLGIEEGDKLMLTVLADGTVQLTTRQILAADFRGAYKQLSSAKSMVDELITERRREAKVKAKRQAKAHNNG